MMQAMDGYRGEPLRKEQAPFILKGRARFRSGPAVRIFRKGWKRALCAAVLVAGNVHSTLMAQAGWKWVIVTAGIASGDTSRFSLTLGIEADSAMDSGSFGNATLRGKMSGDLADFGLQDSPSLESCLPGEYAMTLTDGPDSLDWQLNCVLDGEPRSVVHSPLAVAVLHFRILNPGGHSGIDFIPLQQTFFSDAITRAAVEYDASGGDLPLRHTGVVLRGSDRIPAAFALLPGFPNPFNPRTIFLYQVPEPCRVRILVVSTRGQAIRTLFDGPAEPGEHEVSWDGKGFSGTPAAAGVYLVLMQAGPFFQARKITLLR